MRKLFCDRCGKEVSNIIQRPTDYYFVYKEYDRPDLCMDCLEDLKKFMEEFNGGDKK